MQAHADTLISILDADRAQFAAYQARLAIVRNERDAARLAGRNDDDHMGADNDPNSDAYSDTSSTRSSRFSGTTTPSRTVSRAGTGKTHQSSKNRRKHERKLLSLKPGNAFEDIALVDALHGLAHKAYDQQVTVRALCRALIEQRLDEIGRRVQQALRALLTSVDRALDEIWIAEMRVSGDGVALMEDGHRMDYALVLREQHYAMISEYNLQSIISDLQLIRFVFSVYPQNLINATSPY